MLLPVDLGQHGQSQCFLQRFLTAGPSRKGNLEVYASAGLTKSQVEAAYALIAAFAPDISPDKWREFCGGALAASGKGSRIVAVTDPKGRLRGLAVVEPTRDHEGANLLVPIFAPLSAADLPGVTRALLDFLLAEARIGDCPEIQFGALHPDSWKRYIAGDTLPRSPGTIIRVRA
jgi:hypothetical protein